MGHEGDEEIGELGAYLRGDKGSGKAHKSRYLSKRLGVSGWYSQSEEEDDVWKRPPGHEWSRRLEC